MTPLEIALSAAVAGLAWLVALMWVALKRSKE